MNTKQWMSQLNDDLLISQLTIPGTHDTATYNISGSAGLGFVKTQDLNITQQLEAGCRFLDIRCRLYENHLVLHHGAYYLNLNFNDVINFCSSFLAQNPTETILMSLKEEYDADDNTITYEQAVLSYISQNPDLWYTQDLLPTLGAVRGKIVLLRRFALDANSAPLGIPLNLSDNTSGTNQFHTDPDQVLSYEDLYNPDSVDDKKNAIHDHVNQAQANLDTNWLFLTFTSGYKKFPPYTPSGMADEINPWMLSALTPNQKNMGTFAIDFIDPSLANFFVANNFPITQGYTILSPNGGIHVFGNATYEGHGIGGDGSASGLACTPSRRGYWIVSPNGGIHCYGDATYYGHGVGGDNSAVAIAATPTGHGYWILSKNGGIHTYGDAKYAGHGIGSDGSASAMAVTPSGQGYWLLSPNGGIHTYGDAAYYGHGVGSDNDAIAIVATATGRGYWILSKNGGIHSYGDATYYGHGVNGQTAVAMARTPTGQGYWLLSQDGTIFNYGDANNLGSGVGSDDQAIALGA